MEAKNKKTITESKNKNKVSLHSKKSKIALFWDKYPNGILEIMDMRAVLK